MQVLGGAVPRAYGQPPRACTAAAPESCCDQKKSELSQLQSHAGIGGPAQAGSIFAEDSLDTTNWFHCIAPSPLLDKLRKLKK